MSEREFFRVKKMTVEVTNAGAQPCILNRIVATASIRFITYDRMLHPPKVNANLMSPSCLQFYIQQCESLERTPNSISG